MLCRALNFLRRSALRGERSGTTLTLLVVLASSIWTSQAGAQIFLPSGLLNSNAVTDLGYDSAPRVTTDGAGNWLAVWYSSDTLGETIGADYDILVSRSTDACATWTAPVALNTNAAVDTDNDIGPSVETDGNGNWVAAWHSWDTLSGTIGSDSDILVSRSTDAGVTWTAPAALNSNAAEPKTWADQRVELATDGAENWVAVWESTDKLGMTIGGDLDILVSRSTDAGLTWDASTALNSNAANESERDWNAQVVSDGAGNWVAVWGSADPLGGIGTDDDLLVSRSTDAGLTWTAAAALNTNATTDSGEDFHPDLATDGAGNWVVVWDSDDSLGATIGTDDDILVARSSDAGLTWSSTASLSSYAAIDVGGDASPEVSTDGAGNWVTVWNSNDNLDSTAFPELDIMVSRSSDAGLTWTATDYLNTTAATNSANDNAPHLTNDALGNWAVVWSSTGHLDVTTGNDTDIFYATGTFPTSVPALSNATRLFLAGLVLSAALWRMRREGLADVRG